MAKKDPVFLWDESTLTATCLLHYNNVVYTGIANCHPNDLDMCSEKTGCEIAQRRALISALKGERDNVIKPKLAALKQLYYSMAHSKQFNAKSYEAKTLYRQIKMYEADLDNFTEQIKLTQQKLKQYLIDKDTFYQKIRQMRQAKTK